MMLDGDFPTGAKCPYHCSPSCHPAQVDENEWKYGCTHKAWPQNRAGDFVPIVKCGGDPEKCDIPVKLLKNRKNGRQRVIDHAYSKINDADNEMKFIDMLLEVRK